MYLVSSPLPSFAPLSLHLPHSFSFLSLSVSLSSSPFLPSSLSPTSLRISEQGMKMHQMSGTMASNQYKFMGVIESSLACKKRGGKDGHQLFDPTSDSLYDTGPVCSPG